MKGVVSQKKVGKHCLRYCSLSLHVVSRKWFNLGTKYICRVAKHVYIDNSPPIELSL